MNPAQLSAIDVVVTAALATCHDSQSIEAIRRAMRAAMAVSDPALGRANRLVERGLPLEFCLRVAKERAALSVATEIAVPGDAWHRCERDADFLLGLADQLGIPHSMLEPPLLFLRERYPHWFYHVAMLPGDAEVTMKVYAGAFSLRTAMTGDSRTPEMVQAPANEVWRVVLEFLEHEGQVDGAQKLRELRGRLRAATRCEPQVTFIAMDLRRDCAPSYKVYVNPALTSDTTE